MLISADSAWRSGKFVNQADWLTFRFSMWQYFGIDFIVLIRALNNLSESEKDSWWNSFKVEL